MRSTIHPTYLQFHDLASHFLALTARDRFLRFGWVMTGVRHDRSEWNITLADHSLRSQWSRAASLNTAADELQEQILI